MPSEFEIERKFILKGRPKLPVMIHKVIRQAYLHVDDNMEVRLRVDFDAATYDTIAPKILGAKLCIKHGNGLTRRETETAISIDQAIELARALPSQLFITKHYTRYALGYDGLVFEFSSVDPGLETGFMYGEIEFPCVEAAQEYELPPEVLEVLDDEVTGENAYQLKNYWRRTRLGQK